MVSMTGWWMVSESGDSQGDSVQTVHPAVKEHAASQGCTVVTVVPFDDDVGLNVLGCWADILGALFLSLSAGDLYTSDSVLSVCTSKLRLGRREAGCEHSSP